MEKYGYGRDGRSLRPPIGLPKEPNHSLVSFLFRNVSAYPEKPALIHADSNETLSLCSNPLSSRSPMLFSIWFPLCYLSVTATGAIATTVNPIYTVNELSKQVKDSSPKLVVTTLELFDKVKDFKLPVILLGSKRTQKPFDVKTVPKILSFHDLLDLAGKVTELPAVPVKQTDTAALMYSSGTTGNLPVTCTGFSWCVLPLFHVSGLVVLAYGQLQKGNAVVSMAKFDFGIFLRNVEKYWVTHLWVVPPIALVMAKESVVKKFDLSSLRQIAAGAAPLALMKECAKNFSSGGACAAGMLASSMEAQIVNTESLKPLPPNQLGEIRVRGPNMMQGFLSRLRLTATNKPCTVFTDTVISIIGFRIKKLIKYKGFQVAPAELEGLPVSHPEILDAVVILYLDAEAGEVPVAYIVHIRGTQSSLSLSLS
ncbi:hypothetical protein PTKIN_Ptkin11bG0077400 [Pterospermum kingtungense]